MNSLCYFFFKQKTAYEMRISDWSSDVCSSDLHRRHVARHAPPVGQVTSLAFGHVVDAGRTPVARKVRNAAGVRGDGGRSEQQQIGRASCRERVCQYV